MDGDSYQGSRVRMSSAYPLDKGVEIRADFLQSSSVHTHMLPGALRHLEEGQHDGGGGEKRESWIFREGSRVEEAPFRVTSQWASEPDTAGKELTLVEDLLCARQCSRSSLQG